MPAQSVSEQGIRSSNKRKYIFDDIVIQNNLIYKDPGSPYDFGDVNASIFGNSSITANFRFDNTSLSNNLIHYNNKWGLPIIDIRQKRRQLY